MLPEEETVIPSEPDVQPRTMDQRGGLGPFAIPDKPMSNEPFFDTDMGTVRLTSIEDDFFMVLLARRSISKRSRSGYFDFHQTLICQWVACHNY